MYVHIKKYKICIGKGCPCQNRLFQMNAITIYLDCKFFLEIFFKWSLYKKIYIGYFNEGYLFKKTSSAKLDPTSFPLAVGDNHWQCHPQTYFKTDQYLIWCLNILKPNIPLFQNFVLNQTCCMHDSTPRITLTRVTWFLKHL